MSWRFFLKSNLEFKKFFFAAYTIINLIDSPEKAMDNNLYLEIFIDLQKAFDAIDHLIP